MIIETYKAGQSMHIDGKTYHHDLKIIDGRVLENWWRKEGHRLDLTDITDVVAANPEIIVIGTGYAERMAIPEETRESLLRRNIRIVAQNTNAAVQTYNRLAKEGRKVSGAFHLTC